MNTVVKWFQEKFSKSTRKLDVDAQNRKLLYDSLELCYTKKQIQIVKNVLNNCASSFEVMQRIRFTHELLKRQQLIEYCERKLKQKYYTHGQIHALLQTTTKQFQCNAILLHIERFKEIYTENGDNLAEYFRMVKERKAILLNDIETEL